MPYPIEVTDKKLVLPLSTLRTEIGFSFLYFGFLLGIKASDVLDNIALLGLWVFLLLWTLAFDLLRPDLNPKLNTDKDNLLRIVGISTISMGLTLSVMVNNDIIFSRIESLFRVIYYGQSFANWILLSVILVVSNIFGALMSFRKAETARYARLFPLLALAIIYFRGSI